MKADAGDDGQWRRRWYASAAGSLHPGRAYGSPRARRASTPITRISMAAAARPIAWRRRTGRVD